MSKLETMVGSVSYERHTDDLKEELLDELYGSLCIQLQVATHAINREVGFIEEISPFFKDEIDKFTPLLMTYAGALRAKSEEDALENIEILLTAIVHKCESKWKALQEKK